MGDNFVATISCDSKETAVKVKEFIDELAEETDEEKNSAGLHFGHSYSVKRNNNEVIFSTPESHDNEHNKTTIIEELKTNFEGQITRIDFAITEEDSWVPEKPSLASMVALVMANKM